MTSKEFAYWLHGFTEISNNPPTKEQWKIIKDHLDLVFKKITPKYDLNSNNLICNSNNRTFKKNILYC